LDLAQTLRNIPLRHVKEMQSQIARYGGRFQYSLEDTPDMEDGISVMLRRLAADAALLYPASAKAVAPKVPQSLSVLYVDRNAVAGAKTTYYLEFMNAIREQSSTLCLHTQIDHEDDPFKGSCKDGKYDIVVLGFGQLSEFSVIPSNVSILPWLQRVDIPVVVMMNREHQDLDRKLAWMRVHRSQILCAFTVHHNVSTYSHSTGVPFYRLPYAADPGLYNLLDHTADRKYDYDVGVVGAFSAGSWLGRAVFGLKPRLERVGIRMFYAEALPPKEYSRTMARTKLWLSTLSRGAIVTAQYFEVMASNTTVLMFRRENLEAYEGLGFQDGSNVVMFNVEDLYEKIVHYSRDSVARDKILNRARQHIVTAHTYSRRGEQFRADVRRELLAL